MPAAEHGDFTLLVFARAPLPGSSKTRLIPLLGAEGAAAAQSRLLNHALDTAAAAAPARLQLWCTPDTSHPQLVAAAARHGASLHVQQGADLGARLAHAFALALKDAQRVLCIGSDCPALTAAHLLAAAKQLQDGNDAVLVPAEDGGYVLIGLARNEPRLFSGIDWGGDQVLAQTRTRLSDCGLAWLELEALWDIDRPQDWLRLQASGLLGGDAAA
ncbi:MAG: TIGR04282 family arsenosugar biosynthesis glycosyltransferase [Burkholderiales bacterium]|nr:TIGR04282 family arsenosugar biosynthesis glycosyltransferase [Burkholderiales bacterium]